jgi:hypothetical protein
MMDRDIAKWQTSRLRGEMRAISVLVAVEDREFMSQNFQTQWQLDGLIFTNRRLDLESRIVLRQDGC